MFPPLSVAPAIAPPRTRDGFAIGFPSAATFVLNSDGGGNADTVWLIDVHAGRHRFNITEIHSLMFNRDGGAVAVPGRYVDTDESAGARWRRHAMVPASVEIEVRTIDPIDVREPESHRMFLASIDRDVRDVSGRVMIPKGAPAHLIVRDMGGGEIAIDLRSVSVDGRRYILNA